MKKIKSKYKDQDEEERKFRMEILAVSKKRYLRSAAYINENLCF
jgi:hypothetical protein